MFKFIKNLLGLGAKETVQEILTPPTDNVLITRVAVPESNIKLSSKPQRAKNTKGQFVADDPSTPDVNEAWKGGKAPAKKSKPDVTEGKTKGGNGAVKKPKVNSTKPKAPAKPKLKK